MMPLRPEGRLRVYRYRALDVRLPPPHRPQSGLVLASSAVTARALVVAHVGQAGTVLWLRRRWWPLRWQVGPAEVALFTQQLAALLRAGLPLLQVLNLLADTQAHQVMRQLLRQIQHEVAEGRSLAHTLDLYRPVFGPLYVAVLAAAELSGRLDVALQDLAQSLAKQQHLQRQLRLALAYPLLILTLAVALVVGLIGFVLPSFVTLYEGMGVALPPMTQWLLRWADLLASGAWWVVAGLLLLCLGWHRLRRRHGPFSLWLSLQVLRLPILGPLQQKIIVARWAHTFAMLHAAGLPLLSLLSSVAQVSQHVLYDRATQAVQQGVAQGQSVYAAMRATERFPELLLQLVLAGEEAGALDELLYRAAAYYTDEVDQTMALLSVWIEPLLLLFLGVIVGAVLLALYLPLFNIGDVIG
ncbi:MAG: type II secretion system F family protein [Neisseriaceae bacterium]|nr:type II secretion system F family protein [Neisseriaceae bacterium]